MFEYYRSLIGLRKRISDVLLNPAAAKEILVLEEVVHVYLTAGKSSMWLLMNFATGIVDLPEARRPGRWTLLIDSACAEFSGPGTLAPRVLEGPSLPEIRLQPKSIVLYGDLTSE